MQQTPQRKMNQDRVIGKIRKAVKEAGSQKELADRLKLYPQMISDMIHKRRDPMGRMLEYLGLEQITIVKTYYIEAERGDCSKRRRNGKESATSA